MPRSFLFVLLALVACQHGPASSTPETATLGVAGQLPTGRTLDPVGTAVELGSMPLALVASPDGRQMVALLSGYREQGIQVIDRTSGKITQTVVQPAAFLGLAFSPDGRTLYASGGNQDVVYRYSWREGRATLIDSLVLAPKAARAIGVRYPGGLAPSADGRFLYVAENLADSLAVIDLASAKVVQRFATERWPYGVVVAKNGAVFVSAWGGNTVSTFSQTADGSLTAGPRIRVGRHPSAMLLNASGTRLFVASGSTDRVAVVDVKQRRVLNEILDTPPGGPGEGSTPNALALSADGRRLFIAEADNNAIAIVALSTASAGLVAATGDDRVIGRVPTQWYPTAVVARGDSLMVLAGKGKGTLPNRAGPQPGRGRTDDGFDPGQYTLGQTSGSLVTSLTAAVSGAELDALSARVSRANRWGEPRVTAALPPFEHVLYIIKENRSYDQILGDLPQADGDTSLVFFGRANTPNHHAIAERFGIFDRFFVNAEVSPDGHNWSTAAYTTDYLQKTVPSNYSSRGRTYDWEGTNRGRLPVDDDDVSEPANGYLWNLVQRAGLTFRNFGEFVMPANADPDDPLPAGYRGTKPFLRAHTSPEYPAYDLNVRDQRRADVWLAELARYTAKNEMPALQIMRLPNDHTSGVRAGAPTPRAQVADNDLALGRILAGLSTSPFWKNTVVFVLEDDAQNGPDHVDSHRSPVLIASAWNKPGVYHRFANTTDVIATIERILKLGTLSQFDHFGRPITEVFGTTPDLRPYTALTPAINLGDVNPGGTRGARESALLDLRIEDAADEALFNQILWRALKGDRVPYPGPRRISTLDLTRAR